MREPAQRDEHVGQVGGGCVREPPLSERQRVDPVVDQLGPLEHPLGQPARVDQVGLGGPAHVAPGVAGQIGSREHLFPQPPPSGRRRAAGGVHRHHRQQQRGVGIETVERPLRKNRRLRQEDVVEPPPARAARALVEPEVQREPPVRVVEMRHDVVEVRQGPVVLSQHRLDEVVRPVDPLAGERSPQRLRVRAAGHRHAVAGDGEAATIEGQPLGVVLVQIA